jgi:hypothetical protein
MHSFFEVILLEKKIARMTDNYSGKRYCDWTAGLTSTLPDWKTSVEKLVKIDCLTEDHAMLLLNLLADKGLRTDPESTPGRYLYVYK